MVEENPLQTCSYFLVRYVPDTGREEFLNIGLFFHNAEEQFLDCLFTDDFRRIKRFHAQADLRFLQDLQSHFEQQLQEHESNFALYLQEMQESFSNLIQIAPARSVLTAEPQTEMRQLFERLVGERRANLPEASTRMRIKQRLVEVLRRARVFSDPRFEKRIPAETWTAKGDPFHFDFGYRLAVEGGKSSGPIKLIHALSLGRDNELAHVLANTIRYVRQQEPADLTAIIEGPPGDGDRTARHSYRLLTDAQVIMRPIAEAEDFALSVSKELALSR